MIQHLAAAGEPINKQYLGRPPAVRDFTQSSLERCKASVGANLIARVLAIIHAGGRVYEPAKSMTAGERVAVPVMQADILSRSPVFKKRGLECVSKCAVQYVGAARAGSFE